MTVQTVPAIPATPAEAPAAVPVAEPAPTAPAAAAEPAAPASDVPASPATTAEPAAPPPAVKEDWRDRRIAQLTARLRERERAPTEPVAPVEGTLTQADVDRLATEKATSMAGNAEFNRRCNEAAVAGRQAFPDFTARVSELTKLVDRQDQDSLGAYNRFLTAALETGQAPKVLHALGGDLNEAARILALPAAAQGVALARLADKEPEAVSRVAKPLTPVGGRSASHTEIDPTDAERADNLSTAAWMERRAAQVAQRAGRR